MMLRIVDGKIAMKTGSSQLRRQKLGLSRAKGYFNVGNSLGTVILP
jgi:hypothetical protein